MAKVRNISSLQARLMGRVMVCTGCAAALSYHFSPATPRSDARARRFRSVFARAPRRECRAASYFELTRSTGYGLLLARRGITVPPVDERSRRAKLSMARSTLRCLGRKAGVPLVSPAPGLRAAFNRERHRRSCRHHGHRDEMTACGDYGPSSAGSGRSGLPCVSLETPKRAWGRIVASGVVSSFTVA